MSAIDISEVASKEWRAYVEPLTPIAERLVPLMSEPNDPQLRRELYRGLFQQIASGYLGLLFADPRYPDLWPYFADAFNWLGPNPDNASYIAPIEGKGVYKIAGYRGTVKRVLLQLGNGAFVPQGIVDEHRLGETLVNYDCDDLDIGKDGRFDVVLSAERPSGYHGNWWELPAATTYLFVRQISYDWVGEAHGRFGIERLDTPAARPRWTESELESKLKHVAYWAESLMKATMNFGGAIRQRGWINNVGWVDMTQYGRIVTQKYLYGIYELESDEALVIESDVPDVCRYWSIHLTDDLFFTHDYQNRHTSLNGFLAKVDTDRKTRIVISAQDPGVPNWLDTMGYRTGVIQGRWENCSSWPEHVVTKIKVADVRNYVAADTETMTPEQRDACIRWRRLGVQMRKRW